MVHLAIPGGVGPDDPDLTLRQRRIFALLIDLYGRSARPVGSDVLAHHAETRMSSASVRAELAELERAGLLEREHASSGRVPTAQGYDFYVRALLQPMTLPPELVAEVRRTLERSAEDVERLLHDAAALLASLTRQLGLALATSLADEVLVGLDLALLDGRRVLLVLDLGRGALRTLALELETALEPGELEEVAAVLRERLVGSTLLAARDRLEQDPELVRRSAVRIVATAAKQRWLEPVGTPLFRSGAMHMADQPEFSRSTELGPILRAVEAGSPLDQVLVDGIEGHVGAHVGVTADKALAQCSLVAYPFPGRVRAAVGVLGPLRMNYPLAFSVVELVGAQVADLLPGS